MRHDANNPLCDKNTYPGAEGVKCTCDIDSADDAPAPSTVYAPGSVGAVYAAPKAGSVMLTGSRASAYEELEQATRELDAARKLLEPAQARWRAALDRLSAEILR